ncbi:MAG: hypothetical protein EVJ47_08770 [Candidatus Acidulodesulfobacterium ferriphilum]|jgi:hypothetical protein|uniref:Uncharacterized protein n=1 Tax=Candidatus Acidulodesulfobacterium ferriphilum TaxID=2597223 RepID=A0A519B988_9DELT|nr:MAG: hypothetical protein EVJ47_08770 [Candidatus Acidulodesulfobacterium ferriphilum]
MEKILDKNIESNLFVSDHNRIDTRSLVMHRVIAEKLMQNPELLQKAKDNIKRWRMQGVEVSAFKEWENIIDSGLNNVIRIITANTEESARLRQSTPFTGILTPKERKNIYESFTIGTYNKGSWSDIKR